MPVYYVSTYRKLTFATFSITNKVFSFFVSKAKFSKATKIVPILNEIAFLNEKWLFCIEFVTEKYIFHPHWPFVTDIDHFDTENDLFLQRNPIILTFEIVIFKSKMAVFELE